MIWAVWGHTSRKGHRGQKGLFHQNCYFSCRLHGMVMGLMYIHKLDTFYKSYRLNFDLGSFGVTVVKRLFSLKCYSSYRLHGMVMGLMHIYQLNTLYKSNRLNFQFGVIWGHRGQKVIFTKNAFPPIDYMVWACDSCICISWIPSTKWWV